MKKFILAVAILASLAGFAKGQAVGDLVIVKASAPPSLVPTATSASVYLTIKNAGSTDDELVGISSVRAGMAMLHETVIENDVAKMNHLASLFIPAGSTVEMRAGGMHVMLSGLAMPLKAGDHIPIELSFLKAGVLKIDVVVAKPTN